MSSRGPSTSSKVSISSGQSWIVKEAVSPDSNTYALTTVKKAAQETTAKKEESSSDEDSSDDEDLQQLNLRPNLLRKMVLWDTSDLGLRKKIIVIATTVLVQRSLLL